MVCPSEELNLRHFCFNAEELVIRLHIVGADTVHGKALLFAIQLTSLPSALNCRVNCGWNTAESGVVAEENDWFGVIEENN